MNKLNGYFTQTNNKENFILNGLSGNEAIRSEKIVKKTNFFSQIINSLSIFFKTKITRNWSLVKVIDLNNQQSEIIIKVNDLKNKLGLDLKNNLTLPKEAAINQAANELYLRGVWDEVDYSLEENPIMKIVTLANLPEADKVEILTKLRLINADPEDLKFLVNHIDTLILSDVRTPNEIKNGLNLAVEFLELKKENKALFPDKKIEFVDGDFTHINENVLIIHSLNNELTPLKTYKELYTKASVDATYMNADLATNGCDYAFSDLATDVIAVFDGAGHNSELVHNDQVPHFKNFCVQLKNDLKNRKFDNVDEARQFLSERFNDLAKIFKNLEGVNMGKVEKKDPSDRGYEFAGPALMCGFVATIDDQKIFIGAQVSDCCLYHKSDSGQTIYYPDVDNGLGQQSTMGKGMHLPKYFDFPVDASSEIYAFSDGIGEFVTENEFKEIVNQNQDKAMLLQEFKTAIMGPLKDKGSENRACLAQPKNARLEKSCKVVSNNPQSESNDDISLAYLIIT